MLGRLILCLVLICGVAAASVSTAEARSRSYHYSYHYHHSREHRSSKAKHEFEAMTGHPHGWRGHVVDHIVPLACGGADAPSNMQWQTIADGKAKDKWERRGCKKARQ